MQRRHPLRYSQCNLHLSSEGNLPCCTGWILCIDQGVKALLRKIHYEPDFAWKLSFAPSFPDEDMWIRTVPKNNREFLIERSERTS